VRSIIVLAAAAFVGSAIAADCDGATSATAFGSLAVLLSNPDLDACATKSGYDMMHATGLPSTAQNDKMCPNPSSMQIRSIIVLAAAAFAGAAIAADCDAATSAAAFGSLAVLLSNPDLDACATTSGYDMLHATSVPTPAQNEKMCAAPECHRFIKASPAEPKGSQLSKKNSRTWIIRHLSSKYASHTQAKRSKPSAMQIRSVVVLVTAAFVGSAIAADCDPATSAAAFGSLAVLLSNPDLDACATASAYDMMHATGMPSSAQNKKMCAAPECHRFIKARSKSRAMQIRSIIALAATAFAGSAIAIDCDTATSAAAFGSLAMLLSNPNIEACATKSGYDMMHAAGLPTPAQNDKMCATHECHSLIKAVGSLNPPDCVLLIPTSGAKMNIKALVDAFEPGCKPSRSSANNNKPIEAPTQSTTTADMPTTAQKPSSTAADKPTVTPTPTTTKNIKTSVAPAPWATTNKPSTVPTTTPTTVPTTIPTPWATTDKPTGTPTPWATTNKPTTELSKSPCAMPTPTGIKQTFN
ncbi:TPA: hypothetical protein N0F65_002473, partial [Lagenidium giganteum]